MYPNFWRGLALTQGTFVFFMTAAIIVRYAMVFRRNGARDKALPFHILTIATSYLLAVIFVFLGITEHWDSDYLSYRTILGMVIFILGDIGLVFMLIHIAIQRKYLNVVRNHVAASAELEKVEMAKELRRQTDDLKKDIREVGEKADAAYHEANTVNIKIANLHKEVSTAQEQSGETISHIDETGKDTNTRVRRMEPKVAKRP